MTRSTRTLATLALVLLFAGALTAPASASSMTATGFDSQSLAPMKMIPCNSSVDTSRFIDLSRNNKESRPEARTKTWDTPMVESRPASCGDCDGDGIDDCDNCYRTPSRSPMFAAASNDPLETLQAWSTASSAAPGSAEQTNPDKIMPYEPQFWATSYFGTLSYKDYGNRSGARIYTYGFVVGAHFLQADDFLLGFLMSYEHSSVKIAHGQGNGKTDTFRFGPYAAKQFGRWFTNAELTAGLHSNKYDRNAFGTENKGSFKACDISLATTVGYDFKVCPSTIASPFVSLRYMYYSRQGFSESGPAFTGMRFGSFQSATLTTKIGSKIQRKLTFEGQNMLLGASLAVARRYYLGNRSFSTQSVLGGPTTNIKSQKGPEFFFEYGAHVELPLTDNSYLAFRYSGQSNGFVSHFGSLSYRIAL